MNMAPPIRKFALLVHITTSVGWIGAVVSYLALDITVLFSDDIQKVRAAYLAMELVTISAIVPLSLTSLLTGLIMSLGTSWGLIRHYWVLFKLLLTIIATFVLLNFTQTIGYMSNIAKDPTTSITDLNSLGGSLLHSIGGLVVLILIMILSVYKPRGMTWYGWRMQQKQRKEL